MEVLRTEYSVLVIFLPLFPTLSPFSAPARSPLARKPKQAQHPAAEINGFRRLSFQEATEAGASASRRSDAFPPP